MIFNDGNCVAWMAYRMPVKPFNCFLLPLVNFLIHNSSNIKPFTPTFCSIFRVLLSCTTNKGNNCTVLNFISSTLTLNVGDYNMGGLDDFYVHFFNFLVEICLELLIRYSILEIFCRQL